MHAWESIQKTLDHIETHISEEVEVEKLASLAALSPFYYQRLFSRLVKRPLMEYVKLRRLAKSCSLLAEAGQRKRILDVALDTGFSSHETFTRAFKEAYGMTPEQYRENPVILNQFDKPDLLLNHVMIEEGVPLISDGLVLEMNRNSVDKPVLFVGICGFVPIEGQMPLGEETGVDVPGKIWETFHQMKDQLPRLTGGREVGVAYFGEAPQGSFTYFTGAEASGLTAVDDMPKLAAQLAGEDKRKTAAKLEAVEMGLASWSLPAGDYMVCSFEAEDSEKLVTVALNKAVKYTQLWMEQNKIKTESYSPEIYPGSPDDGASRMELWIPLSNT